MEDKPPPYNPSMLQYQQDPVPTAPMHEQVNGVLNLSSMPITSPVFPLQTGEYNASNNTQFFTASQADLHNPLPGYSPTTSPIQEGSPPVHAILPPSQPAVHSVRPLRCKAGTVEVGDGNITDVDQIRSWKSQYVEVRDSILFISPARNKPTQMTTIPLKDRFVSMAGKRMIAIQGGCHTLVLRASSEVRAHQWLMTLAQYCFVAPMMEGYNEKWNRGKKVFKERFLKLSSDGVLSWYKSDSEDSERCGSIQLRGVPCNIDDSNPKIIHAQIDPKPYQFRFSTPRESQLWLAAFQWHYGRKPLRKASVPLRNKVK